MEVYESHQYVGIKESDGNDNSQMKDELVKE
jgi:hypothetical protein